MAEVLTDEPVAAKGGNHASGTAGAEVEEAGAETIEDNEPDWSSSVPFGVLSDQTGHMPNNSTTNAIEAMVNAQIAAGEVGDQYDQYSLVLKRKPMRVCTNKWMQPAFRRMTNRKPKLCKTRSSKETRRLWNRRSPACPLSN